MTVVQALIAFSIAAGLLTLTPGLDTALVLRTAAVEGPKRAWLAALGIGIGCLVWGGAVAVGLAALLKTSALAFTALKWAGATYLVWLGIGMLLRPRDRIALAQADASRAGDQGQDWGWLRKGLLTNLLNPKIGVFYVSFLPQFLPNSVAPAPFIFLLAGLHVFMSWLWFAVLIGATRPISGILQRAPVVRWLERITGGVFLSFGVNLALARR